MVDYRYGGHTVGRLTVHLVWVTKWVLPQNPWVTFGVYRQGGTPKA